MFCFVLFVFAPFRLFVNYLFLTFRVVEWDIINEYLHSQFYTANINDPLLIDKVHKQVHDIDPDVRLFLNDYECLRSSEYTSVSHTHQQ